MCLKHSLNSGNAYMISCSIIHIYYEMMLLKGLPNVLVGRKEREKRHRKAGTFMYPPIVRYANIWLEQLHA